MPRMLGSKLPHLPDFENIFIEYLGLDHVLSNLQKLGCTWMVNERYQKGFDVTINQDEKRQLIEVKSRGIGEYSGVKYESDTQKNYPRRHFNFSEAQVDKADYFICVFVGPEKRSAIVVPKYDFHILESTVKGRITAIEGNPLINNRKIDISKWVDAWNLILQE